MKSKLGILLGSALLLAAGCSEETVEAVKAANYTSDYDLGALVVSTGLVTSTTKTFVQIGDKVTQVDDLAAVATTSATSGVCQIDVDLTKTEYATTTTGISSTRIAGTQQAWIIPGTYGSSDVDGDVNMHGTPAWGEMFFSKPELDIYIDTQRRASCGAGDCLEQYIEPVEVTLNIFETDYQERTTDVSRTTATGFEGDYEDHYSETRDLDFFARFNMKGYEWETWDLDSLYSDYIWFNADMVVPAGVKVGDAWLNDNGNLVGAVAIEKLIIGGKAIAALHIVERGSTELDLTANGVNDWCVNFFTATDESTTTAGVTTTYIEKRANLHHNCAYNNRSSGWINLSHRWYFKGMIVREVKETVNVNVLDYGYMVGNTGVAGDEPSGNIQSGGAFTLGNAGNCTVFNNDTDVTGDPDQMKRLQTYARYEVTKSSTVWQATEIRNDFTLVKEFREDSKPVK